MINYFVVRGKQHTLLPFLRSWPNPSRDLFRVVHYDFLPLLRRVHPGICIFSDIDRLDPAETTHVERLCDVLIDRFGPSLVANHPREVLRRFELLRTLWARGVNRFCAFRSDARSDDIRFPAFLRCANDHGGPLTGILHSPGEHRGALGRLASAGTDLSHVITIEFCDTRDPDGLYRKYSAFLVGGQLIPGHVIVSPDWVTKDSRPEPLREEERQYLARNPHREELLCIFRIAGIDYGRIDYGLLEGRIQVWEINTNPVLIQEREKYSSDKLTVKQELVDRLSQAFLDLHGRMESVPGGRVRVPKAGGGMSLAPFTGLARLLLGFDL